MMAGGIMIRSQKLNKFKVDTSHILKAMTTYSVETEGVLFFHVKYFVYFLAAAIVFAFFILIIEIIVFRMLNVVR